MAGGQREVQGLRCGAKAAVLHDGSQGVELFGVEHGFKKT